MAANKPFANLDRLSKLATPTPKPFDYKPQQGESKVRLDFAQSISLQDRLKQTDLKTTNHLTQYILSDQNTGYIKIKGTTVTEGKSTVQINKSVDQINQGSIFLPPYNPDINQGEVSLRVRNTDSLLKQGATLSQGVYASHVSIKSPSSLLESTTRQGTFTTNQVTFSLTQVEDPKQNLDQGSTVINKILATPNQGSIKIGGVATIGAIEAKQGIRKFNQKIVSTIDPVAPLQNIEIVVPHTIFIPNTILDPQEQIPNSIRIVNAKPANAYINDQEIQIKTLGYLADKASNVLFPSLNHGGELPQNRGVISKNGSTPHSIVDADSSLKNSILLEEDGTYLDILNPAGITKVPSGVSGEKTGFIPGSNNSKSTSRSKNTIKVLSGVLNANQATTAIQALASDDEGLRDYTAFANSRGETEDGKYFTVQTIQGVDGFSNNPNILYSKGLSADSADEVAGFVTNYVNVDKQKGSVYKKERASWNNSNGRRKYAEISSYSQLEGIVKDKEANPTQLSVTEYVVKLVGANGTVSFTAFLTSFSDSYTANWTDYNHVGQMDTFKVYKGATRQLSVAFKVVSGLGEFQNSPNSAGAAVAKLNTLVNTAIVGKYSGNYVEGPIVTLTIAGLINGIKCAIGSVKVDADVAETGWDEGKPHIYSVSLDAAVLAHKSDNLFSPSTTYLG